MENFLDQGKIFSGGKIFVENFLDQVKKFCFWGTSFIKEKFFACGKPLDQRKVFAFGKLT